MSANMEKAIQEEVRRLTDEQQQQVMAFVESLKLGFNENAEDKQLSLAATALLADYQSDPELTAFTALDGEDFRHA
jgi:hypothetical protein